MCHFFFLLTVRGFYLSKVTIEGTLGLSMRRPGLDSTSVLTHRYFLERLPSPLVLHGRYSRDGVGKGPGLSVVGSLLVANTFQLEGVHLSSSLLFSFINNVDTFRRSPFSSYIFTGFHFYFPY